MKLMKWMARAAGVVALLAGCTGQKAQEGVSHKAMADALHAVMEADRTVYTRLIVNRLQNEEKIIKASEHWKDEKALVLPAQMFRFGAEMVAEKNVGFSYSLLSLWPVNKQNAPKTPIEEEGLKAVAAKPEEPFYKEEARRQKVFHRSVPGQGGRQSLYHLSQRAQGQPALRFQTGWRHGGRHRPHSDELMVPRLLALVLFGVHAAAYSGQDEFPEFADPRLQLGRKIWLGTCRTCHATDLAGAPRIADKAAWAPRVKKGKDVLYQHALDGFFGPAGTEMPAEMTR